MPEKFNSKSLKDLKNLIVEKEDTFTNVSIPEKIEITTPNGAKVWEIKEYIEPENGKFSDLYYTDGKATIKVPYSEDDNIIARKLQERVLLFEEKIDFKNEGEKSIGEKTNSEDSQITKEELIKNNLQKNMQNQNLENRIWSDVDKRLDSIGSVSGFEKVKGRNGTIEYIPQKGQIFNRVSGSDKKNSLNSTNSEPKTNIKKNEHVPTQIKKDTEIGGEKDSNEKSTPVFLDGLQGEWFIIGEKKGFIRVTTNIGENSIVANIPKDKFEKTIRELDRKNFDEEIENKNIISDIDITEAYESGSGNKDAWLDQENLEEINAKNKKINDLNQELKDKKELLNTIKPAGHLYVDVNGDIVPQEKVFALQNQTQKLERDLNILSNKNVIETKIPALTDIPNWYNKKISTYETQTHGGFKFEGTDGSYDSIEIPKDQQEKINLFKETLEIESSNILNKKTTEVKTLEDIVNTQDSEELDILLEILNRQIEQDEKDSLNNQAENATPIVEEKMDTDISNSEGILETESSEQKKQKDISQPIELEIGNETEEHELNRLVKFLSTDPSIEDELKQKHQKRIEELMRKNFDIVNTINNSTETPKRANKIKIFEIEATEELEIVRIKKFLASNPDIENDERQQYQDKIEELQKRIDNRKGSEDKPQTEQLEEHKDILVEIQEDTISIENLEKIMQIPEVREIVEKNKKELEEKPYMHPEFRKILENSLTNPLKYMKERRNDLSKQTTTPGGYVETEIKKLTDIISKIESIS